MLEAAQRTIHRRGAEDAEGAQRILTLCAPSVSSASAAVSRRFLYFCRVAFFLDADFFREAFLADFFFADLRGLAGAALMTVLPCALRGGAATVSPVAL